MGRVVRSIVSWSLPFAALFMVACQSSGVGDPCTPEQIPEGGFRPGESYLETSSVQCRTRVCMVQDFEGDPSKVFYGPGDSRNTCEVDEEGCNYAAEVEDSVFCTCRCGAPAGSNTPTCECPSGFECAEILQGGGIGIQGSYCVRKDTGTPAGDAG
jgi:hypothetical protein